MPTERAGSTEDMAGAVVAMPFHPGREDSSKNKFKEAERSSYQSVNQLKQVKLVNEKNN